MAVSLIQKQKKLGKQINRLSDEGFKSFGVYSENEEEITIKEI